jgi:hypothetical protein
MSSKAVSTALSQWVQFKSLHDRFHDLVYQLRLRRKYFLTRIPSCLSFAQLADDLLDHFFHPPSLPMARQRIEQRLGVLQVGGVEALCEPTVGRGSNWYASVLRPCCHN